MTPGKTSRANQAGRWERIEMDHARTPFVGGNWKMNLTLKGAGDLAREVGEGAGSLDAVDVAVFPTFVHLETVRRELADSGVALGAQDVYFETAGAFTGEVSGVMLADAGAGWALAGHSERRHVIGESDELVGRKVEGALKAGLKVVLCVGETEDQRDAGETDPVNERQLREGLRLALQENEAAGSLEERLVIAYEPVWAIGTGKTATPEDAQRAHEHIRAVLGDLIGTDDAQRVRIVYGGSMKPDNAGELMSQSDIDGGLVGGASLKADDFLAICRAAAATTSGVG
jgi:triosephosphate isomerase